MLLLVEFLPLTILQTSSIIIFVSNIWQKYGTVWTIEIKNMLDQSQEPDPHTLQCLVIHDKHGEGGSGHCLYQFGSSQTRC